MENTATMATPSHIAIIMDGNGRWANQRHLPRKIGHRQGAEALRTILTYCRELPFLTHLTVYAFSSENWNRPEDEVTDLMQLLTHYLSKESKTLHENGVRIRFIGDRSRLQDEIRAKLQDVETLTATNHKFTLVIALSYGSRQEIRRAMAKLAKEIVAGTLSPEEISEDAIASALDTYDIPDPDLLIRTGGDQRLSNFLLWQSAYTEFYFSDALWPDFTPDHLNEAIQCFGQRERRFGTRPK